MTTSRNILGAALIVSWAILLSARCLAAAIGSAHPGGSYEAVLEHIGWLLPVSAWVSLITGLTLFLRSGICYKTTKDGDTK
jgi:hypothetical protein